MKLAYVDFCGFRGYRKQVRIEFGSRFTVIDGRNGTGKSTIFDAVEYALTGDIKKYNSATAGRESVLDYVWWRGGGVQPKARYVEVGFIDDNQVLPIRRTEFEGPSREAMNVLSERLCDQLGSPNDCLSRLFARSILRDEQIAELSLDLKETDRYALLKDGLGVSDADKWIARAQNLLAIAKKRVEAAQSEVDRLNLELANARKRVDEARISVVAEGVIGQAIDRLSERFTALKPSGDIVAIAQEAVIRWHAAAQEIEAILSLWGEVDKRRPEVTGLEAKATVSRQQLEEAERALGSLTESIESKGESSSEINKSAHDLATILELGRQLGLQAGHCPLCAAAHDPASFTRGVAKAAEVISRLDSRAAELAKQEWVRRELARQVVEHRNELSQVQALLLSAKKIEEELEVRLQGLDLKSPVTREGLQSYLGTLSADIDAVNSDLRIADGIRLNAEVGRYQRSADHVESRLQDAQRRAAAVRGAGQSARLIFDAARRAATETLDRRLEQVLPLMAELYQRLRPHPYWRDIEYSIRGDVRKFIKLQVGDELNPQFMFSSGQRRATGLAFLLSINLSIAWSKFRTVMLDDPVQHVDDFRTVHLAEVFSQLVSQGRQIVCSVEDPVLADLMCRRMPVGEYGAAKRVSLAPDDAGDLGVIRDEFIAPMPSNILVPIAGAA